ncbi:ACP phosphodiesterase [Flavobacterium sp. CBA20B-1]|uniref:acyl carrier protein phosphodiesterase n=1 Tax=unclassified Flavobacterium TaxID=196869 RepID=UPI0022259C3B|nr:MULTISPECIES: ACP phosphodiesterase [unclassified Flavobacterium]WCM42794.1 ACP phosphodiesterase [Flavobacterium sp. CBA20B-1]
MIILDKYNLRYFYIMNFLAHIYLSGTNERIQIGNFMGDGIRGKDYKNYHNDIQIGVLLHRSIDSFTDFHPIFRQSKHRLVPKYNHFSGIIVDMFYDHFLAKEWKMYHHEDLQFFTQRFYQSLENHQDELNLKTQQLLPYLTHQNWLERYAHLTDLQQILQQMDNRFAMKSNMSDSVDDLHTFYDDFQREFHLFFKDLMIHSDKELQRLVNEFKK